MGHGVEAMYRIAAIDGACLARRKYEAGRLYNGFLNTIKDIKNTYNPSIMYVCWDNGRGYREEIYKEYKANREPPPSEYLAQVKELKYGLGLLGITQVEAMNGGEGDDVLATIAYTMRGPVVIWTADKDLLQCVSKHAHVVRSSPVKEGLGTIHTISNFGDMTGVSSPELWVAYQALVGDSVDNIPGIKGIGDKTAKRLLEKMPNIVPSILHCDEVALRDIFEHTKDKKHIDECLRDKDRLKLALNLVTLKNNLKLNFQTGEKDKKKYAIWANNVGVYDEKKQ